VADAVARLPAAVRADLKEPLGPVFTDADELLADAGRPLVAVGDVVTAHLLAADADPDVVLFDRRTQREAVDEGVAATLADRTPTHAVENEAGTLSAALVAALIEGLAGGATIEVDGEEDLAVLPAVVAAPEGATVVYGQPEEGMVRVAVDAGTRARARALLERFDTEARLWRLLDLEPPG
jgi:uncharacterized protein (UPF0218 family)